MLVHRLVGCSARPKKLAGAPVERPDDPRACRSPATLAAGDCRRRYRPAPARRRDRDSNYRGAGTGGTRRSCRCRHQAPALNWCTAPRRRRSRALIRYAESGRRCRSTPSSAPDRSCRRSIPSRRFSARPASRASSRRPGEPGCAMVLVRHSSVPLFASSATMKQPLLVPGLVQPEMPATTLPLATIGPPVNV